MNAEARKDKTRDKPYSATLHWIEQLELGKAQELIID